MRFMMILKASKNSEAGVMPSAELLTAMGNYNETLVNAGVMLDCAGLQASSKGVRVDFRAGKRIVTDGPFTETKELIAGFWMIQVKSKQEAIEWFLRCPIEVEIRQVFDAADFAPVIQTEEGRATMAAEEEFRKRTGT